MVTDDLATYKPVAEELDLGHQACLARVRKNARNRLKKMKGRQWLKSLIWKLVAELPEGGGSALMRIERMARSNEEEDELRRLVVELIGKWLSLTRHRRDPWTPNTNNGAESVIGRSKIRYKTLRGYKGESGTMNGLGPTQWAWIGRYGLHAGELLAA